MDKNRFFRLIWRFNALLLTSTCLLVAGSWIYEHLPRSRRPEWGGNKNRGAPLMYKGQVKEANWRFDDPCEVEGADLKIVPLRLVGLKDDEAPWIIRNLLFTDEHGAGRWLLPNNRTEILDWELLKRPGESKITAIGYVMSVGSGIEVSISPADGSKISIALSGVARVIKMSVGADGDVVVLFVRNEQLWLARVPVADPARTQITALPQVISD